MDCDEHDFYCVSEPEVCFSRDNVCDGVPNCIDDSDEKNCSYPRKYEALFAAEFEPESFEYSLNFCRFRLDVADAIITRIFCCES